MTDAAAAYMAKYARARTMLRTLAQLLDVHAAEHLRDPDRWDYVGDITALNERLGDATAGLTRDESEKQATAR